MSTQNTYIQNWRVPRCDTHTKTLWVTKKSRQSSLMLPESMSDILGHKSKRPHFNSIQYVFELHDLFLSLLQDIQITQTQDGILIHKMLTVHVARPRNVINNSKTCLSPALTLFFSSSSSSLFSHHSLLSSSLYFYLLLFRPHLQPLYPSALLYSSPVNGISSLI